jgi:hypothetical protein
MIGIETYTYRAIANCTRKSDARTAGMIAGMIDAMIAATTAGMIAAMTGVTIDDDGRHASRPLPWQAAAPVLHFWLIIDLRCRMRHSPLRFSRMSS